MTDSKRQHTADSARRAERRITVEPSPKRVRAMFNGETVVDSSRAVLLLEAGHRPVYYFPREDVRTDLLAPTTHGTHCPYKGDASYWNLRAGERTGENAAWSYESPIAAMSGIAGLLAFYWKLLDHWFEEDEEIFGHPRDPYHRVDVRASAREVRVLLGGEVIARTRRGLFVFETGLPARYYIPPDDVRTRFLQPSVRTSVCPYKGQASYWSLALGERVAEDAVWSYPRPLPECPRIAGYYCFDPKKVDGLEVDDRS